MAYFDIKRIFIKNIFFYDQFLQHVDLVLYDFKHTAPIAHQLFTGVSNDIIWETPGEFTRNCISQFW